MCHCSSRNYDLYAEIIKREFLACIKLEVKLDDLNYPLGLKIHESRKVGITAHIKRVLNEKNWENCSQRITDSIHLDQFFIHNFYWDRPLTPQIYFPNVMDSYLAQYFTWNLRAVLPNWLANG